ncbi:glutathione S-transferase family protein [soil metagenome]
MIKLFGHPGSTCTRNVLFTLNETSTPYEFVLVDIMKGEHKQPAHMARQPFGQLPAIEDDGFKLYESRAIARYLDEKAGFKLTPKDAQQRAKMEQWISVETSDFSSPAMTFIYQGVFKRPQTPEDLKKAADKVELVSSIIDKSLTESGKPFLVGDQFTIADISFAPYLEYSMLTDAKNIYSKYPQMSAWWNRVSERPTWQKIRTVGF